MPSLPRRPGGAVTHWTMPLNPVWPICQWITLARGRADVDRILAHGRPPGVVTCPACARIVAEAAP